MKDKATIRYLGYRTLADGGRGFDFSVSPIGGETTLITIEASVDLFTGRDRIAIQEGAGICYETLKSRFETDSEIPPTRFELRSADIAQHRRSQTPAQAGARRGTLSVRTG
jgi:hypothetical protein